MIQKYILLFTIAVALVLTSFLFLYEDDVKQESMTINNSAYRDSFRYTCGIVPADRDFNEGGGTGVLLDSGYILTVKHNIDLNRNAKVDREEKIVKLKFYYPKEVVMYGVCVYITEGKFTKRGNIDAAIIIPEYIINEGASLSSIYDFQNVGVGDSIYTVGRTYGDNPTISTGHQGTQPYEYKGYRQRAQLPVWHGNSGGGVFLEDGNLIGLVATMRKEFPGIAIPNWTGYVGARDIRLHFLNEGVEEYLGNTLLQIHDQEEIYFSVVIGIIWLLIGGIIAREILR